jgi:hypothetical protein
MNLGHVKLGHTNLGLLSFWTLRTMGSQDMVSHRHWGFTSLWIFGTSTLGISIFGIFDHAKDICSRQVALISGAGREDLTDGVSGFFNFRHVGLSSQRQEQCQATFAVQFLVDRSAYCFCFSISAERQAAFSSAFSSFFRLFFRVGGHLICCLLGVGVSLLGDQRRHAQAQFYSSVSDALESLSPKGLNEGGPATAGFTVGGGHVAESIVFLLGLGRKSKLLAGT